MQSDGRTSTGNRSVPSVTLIKASDTSILPFRRMVLIRAAVMPAVAIYEGTRLSIILSKASSHISGVMNSVAVVPFSSNDVAQTLKHISFSR